MGEQHPWSAPAWLGQPTAGGAAPEPEPERFTLPAQEVPRDVWLSSPKPQTRPQRAPRKPPVPLGVAMPSVILLALLSTFFSWVVAEPIWLAVGHSQTGTATVAKCVGSGLGQRCTGELDGARVVLLGVADTATATGTKIKVQRVGEHSDRAYAGGLFLRWFLGLAMVLACGAGIALVTGVLRMRCRRDRLCALGSSLAAPLLVTVGFLAASF